LTCNAQGNLYGATQEEAYELQYSAGPWNLVPLQEFPYNSAQGGDPDGSLLVDPSGNIFGTAKAGSKGYGVVFELNPASELRED
jgi:hypothetical protein